jgi:methyltransferase (TIGR00027 family)
MGDELAGVSRTAVWMAEMRAVETAREDSLFDDLLARAFAARGGEPPTAMQLLPGTAEFLAIRTRFYDDRISAGARQIVLLAAGLDCRAFRLDWPAGVRVFEVDLPELFAFKEPVLAAHEAVAACERVVVPADLRGDWPEALAAAGFDASAPTAWIAEGLLPYLSPDDAARLLTTITTLSAPGSGLAYDQMDTSANDRQSVRAVDDTIRGVGAQLTTTTDDPVTALAALGWAATVSRVPALGDTYGRPLPEGTDLAAANATMLVSAVRA